MLQLERKFDVMLYTRGDHDEVSWTRVVKGLWISNDDDDGGNESLGL